MQVGLQNKIAAIAGISNSFFSMVVRGRRRPSWTKAKRLAEATASDPVLWLEGSPAEMKAVLNDLEISFVIRKKSNGEKTAEIKIN